MSVNKKIKEDVEWRIGDKKKPFAYSTMAESDTIALLLEKDGDLRESMKKDYLLSNNERFIINTYIENGIFKPNIR